MPDREKVIKGLGIVSRMLNEMGRRNEMDIIDDALALLKDYDTQLQYRDDHIAMYQAEVKRLEALLKEQDMLIAEARNEGYNEAYRSYCVEVAEEDQDLRRILPYVDRGDEHDPEM